MKGSCILDKPMNQLKIQPDMAAVEITPEMRSSGALVLERWSGVYPPDDLAALVFEAMLSEAQTPVGQS